MVEYRILIFAFWPLAIEGSLAPGAVVAERISSSLAQDLEVFSFVPPRSDGLWFTRIEKFLRSTARTSPVTESLAIGGQLSRDTRRFSELLAADLLLERAAGSSALAGDEARPVETLGAVTGVFVDMLDGLKPTTPRSWLRLGFCCGKGMKEDLSKWSGSPSLGTGP